MKEVSLYIPCFNAARTIRPCLEAIFKQTYPLKEIVVVDDGSTDETLEIIPRYSVKLIRHRNNQGLASARNIAIKNINTEFIASLDADCVPDPDWLKILMKRFNSPKISGAGGKLLEAHSSTVFDLWRSVHMKQYWDDNQTNPPFLFGSNTVFRKKALVDIGLYNENYKNNYEDVDLSERLRQAGYFLVYEPEALMQHLKKDSINSILDNYWQWNISYYQKKEWYSTQKNFILKVKDNIGLANRYIEEDITFHRDKLLYLDFLLALHHSLRDFEYFICQNNQKNPSDSKYSPLSCWLALLDLTFFYHLDFKSKNLSTLIPRENAILQNFLALNLILSRFIQERFKNTDFQKILYKHLFLTVYKMNDNYLLDKLLNLIEFHRDWSQLLTRKQVNLDISFLENLFLHFQEWTENLIYRYPAIIQMIEISARKTEDVSIYEGGCHSENKNK